MTLKLFEPFGGNVNYNNGSIIYTKAGNGKADDILKYPSFLGNYSSILSITFNTELGKITDVKFNVKTNFKVGASMNLTSPNQRKDVSELTFTPNVFAASTKKVSDALSISYSKKSDSDGNGWQESNANKVVSASNKHKKAVSSTMTGDPIVDFNLVKNQNIQDQKTLQQKTSSGGGGSSGGSGGGGSSGGSGGGGSSGGSGGGGSGGGSGGGGSSGGSGGGGSSGGSGGGGSSGGSGGSSWVSRVVDTISRVVDTIRGWLFPIVLDLDGDGVELVDLKNSNVFFDINNDGYRNNMGWANADDGFLVIDLNNDKRITDFRELAFKEYDDNAKTDLDGLKQFDSNGDGYLDSGDTHWNKFGVWQDKNQNGITDAGEFKTLDAFGMKRLKLDSDGKTPKNSKNISHGTGEYEMNNGTKRKFGDIGLSYSDLGFKIRANGDVDMRSVTYERGHIRKVA